MGASRNPNNRAIATHNSLALLLTRLLLKPKKLLA
jgi:hypothetical protein